MESDNQTDSEILYALRFGEIAILKGFITTSQLSEALEEQVSNDPSTRLRPHRLIGEILFEKGWITQNQIAIVLEELIKNARQHS